MMHILRVAAMLFMAWPFTACERTLVEGLPELSVSIYIPEMGTTKAETRSVGAVGDETKFTSLQLWVFLHGGTNDGQLVGYRGFTSEELLADTGEELLADTGLQHSTITRFGMPLAPDMFNTLSATDARVDVYALANAASVPNAASLDERTTRSELDGIVLSGTTFGASSLTMAVPAAGLPMSGVLKGATVTGGYPVLNISTVTLTRAVSKIRFVFSQQGTPAIGETPASPSNTACVIKSITFGGKSAGHDCQIATEERLFTVEKLDGTDDLFDIVDLAEDSYTPFSTVIAGNPLIPNADISVCERPDQLLFQSRGHEMETAQEYESRLDAAVAASSQIGPIYIRETDKLISGTIVYNAGEGDVTANFTMTADDSNVLSRNHSWILYAYFAEATKDLEFKIVVLPWNKWSYDYGYETETVNVVRRFTIPESHKYTKHKTDDGYYDIYFWPILNDQPNVVKGDIIIATPVGQKIHVVPVPGAPEGRTPIEGLFTVSPMETVIYPNGTTTEDCKIEYEITCNPGSHPSAELEGNYIDLHFCVEIGDNERWIDLGSESIDYYRIILKEDWKHGEEN